MSESTPVDPSLNQALRVRLEAWLNQQNQALLEEVMATWQNMLERFHPDEALLGQIREAASVAPPAAAQAQEPGLGAALDLLEGAASQSDLLKRLLDALAPLVERSALYILKQGLASLYAHRGFEADPSARPAAFLPPQELESLIQGPSGASRGKGPGYTALLAPLGSAEAPQAAIFPLRHKRKTVALILVDSGHREQLAQADKARALVLVASAMLASLAAGKDEDTRTHAAPEPVAPVPTQIRPEPEAPPMGGELDPRTRAAAERLARVLVGDVELYFPAKVAQARTQGNLYGQLRDELERSRATFVERFGEGVEKQYRIFTSTLIQQLCDGDASKLGAAPWGP